MCALAQNPGTLLAARFLSGFVGVATITIGSGTIADMMPRQRRGKAVSIWSVGTILGPMIGPIIGGYVAQELGWRWIFWSVSIVVSNQQELFLSQGHSHLMFVRSAVSQFLPS